MVSDPLSPICHDALVRITRELENTSPIPNVPASEEGRVAALDALHRGAAKVVDLMFSLHDRFVAQSTPPDLAMHQAMERHSQRLDHAIGTVDDALRTVLAPPDPGVAEWSGLKASGQFKNALTIVSFIKKILPSMGWISAALPPPDQPFRVGWSMTGEVPSIDVWFHELRAIFARVHEWPLIDEDEAEAQGAEPLRRQHRHRRPRQRRRGRGPPVTWLPDEILTLVFEHVGDIVLLDVVPRVCRRWWAVSGDLCQRKEMDLDLESLKEDSALRCFLKYKAGARMLRGLLTRCPNVVSLDLSRQNLHSDAIDAIANHCPQLKSISFSSSDTVTTEHAATVIKACRRLTSVNMSSCKKIDWRVLSTTLATSCPRLTHFEGGPSLSAHREMDCAVLASALSVGCPLLTSVTIPGCGEELFMQHTHAWVLMAKASRLTSITFHNARVEDQSLREFAQHAAHLTNVSLAFSHGLTGTGLAALAASCPHLVSVDFQYCETVTNDGLLALGEHCPRLTSADFFACPLVTEEGISGMVRGCPLMERLFFENVTDAGALAIATHCRNLNCIMLNRSKALTDLAVVALCVNCPKLRRMLFSDCPKLSDTSAVAIAQLGRDCGNRITVGCEHWKGLTDDGVDLWWHNSVFPFSLVSNPNVTDEGRALFTCYY
eukprot:m.468044 g.468044  ORF g.468044 m.468044 type:complete len:662 (+) comp27117_c0_seq1:149-2134(+)